ncbi:hypothetical protein [uncultured Clostridium sp.]|uniref:hypothetical protein n=1 Tax=uncultured Clostridium sp. TaxID=59620 RepID=UPI0026104D05|nr:hypothetical protein [uncultured Clostridium sp.]
MKILQVIVILTVLEKVIIIIDNKIIKKKYGFSLVDRYRDRFKAICCILTVLIVLVGIFLFLFGK